MIGKREKRMKIGSSLKLKKNSSQIMEVGSQPPLQAKTGS
jgi:hypothetical protein